MQKSALFIIALVTTPMLIANASAAPEYVPNQLLVSTKGTESDSRLQEMNTLCGTKIERPLMVMTRGKIYILQITDGRSVEDAIRCWEQFTEVDYAEPNYIMKPMK